MTQRTQPLASLRWLRAALGLALLLAIAGPWLLMPRGWPIRRRLDLVAWWALLGGFGLRVRCHGAPLRGAGTLFVANHISWTDIPVLAQLLGAGFVAKGEVRRWPVIGALAAGYGCLFIERERRGQARTQAQAVRGHLGEGAGLVLFPEGTTGDGSAVLPFRSSLFGEVVGAEAVRVQPVAIRYSRHDGTAFPPDERGRIAWQGEDALLPHALALAAGGGALVEVWFEEPIAGDDRKALARASREAIVRRLEGG